MNNSFCLCCGKPIEGQLWHSACIKRFFGATALPEININENELKALAVRQLEGRSGIAGVQEKLSLHLELRRGERPRLTIIGFPSGYILKPQASSYKRLPEFEHTAMLLAEHCEIPVVPHGLLEINEKKELAYICKRLDRQGNKKIHMEDFCQASGNLTENKYRSSYEECMAIIKQYSSRSELDKMLLFKALYFCFVIGNSDVHLKNISFIMDDDGKLSLAPFYDFLPTKVILPSDHEDLGMLFNGRKRDLHKHDFDQFCKHVCIDANAQRYIMEAINRTEGELARIIDASCLDQNSKIVWKKMIHSNIKRAKLP